MTNSSTVPKIFHEDFPLEITGLNEKQIERAIIEYKKWTKIKEETYLRIEGEEKQKREKRKER